MFILMCIVCIICRRQFTYNSQTVRQVTIWLQVKMWMNFTRIKMPTHVTPVPELRGYCRQVSTYCLQQMQNEQKMMSCHAPTIDEMTISNSALSGLNLLLCELHTFNNNNNTKTVSSSSNSHLVTVPAF